MKFPNEGEPMWRHARQNELIKRCSPGVVIMSNPENVTGVASPIIMIMSVTGEGPNTKFSYIYYDPISNNGNVEFVREHYAIACILWDDILVYDPEEREKTISDRESE